MSALKLTHQHTPEAISQRLSEGPSSSYLRDWIYGGIDGAVTTFAVVSGSAGAQLSAKTILILGFANLIADGFSMAAGNYLGTKAETEQWQQLDLFERYQIRNEPHGEAEEIRQILRRKGFQGDLLESAVQRITSDPENWVRMMLTEEYGLPFSIRSASLAALSTFSAFLICGFIPLAPFVFGASKASSVASLLTLLVFFGIGSFKSHWSLTSWWKSGVTTLALGASAAGLAYGVGWILSRYGS